MAALFLERRIVCETLYKAPVIPAKAGIPFTLHAASGAPAFAGVTN